MDENCELLLHYTKVFYFFSYRIWIHTENVYEIPVRGIKYDLTYCIIQHERSIIKREI